MHLEPTGRYDTPPAFGSVRTSGLPAAAVKQRGKDQL